MFLLAVEEDSNAQEEPKFSGLLGEGAELLKQILADSIEESTKKQVILFPQKLVPLLKINHFFISIFKKVNILNELFVQLTIIIICPLILPN